MGKFAGFLKRAKNFLFETVPNTYGKNIAKGVFAANKFYKKYEPIIDAGIHLGLEAIGGPIASTIGGTFASLGLKRASQLADKAEWGYNHPGEFWSNYDKNIIRIPSKKA